MKSAPRQSYRDADKDTRIYPPTERYTVRDEKDSTLGIKETHPSYGTMSSAYAQAKKKSSQC